MRFTVTRNPETGKRSVVVENPDGRSLSVVYTSDEKIRNVLPIPGEPAIFLVVTETKIVTLDLELMTASTGGRSEPYPVGLPR